MKLVIAIVQDQDAAKASTALASSGFQSTRLASTGGFLHSGNTTLLIGVENEQVGSVCNILKSTCQARSKTINTVLPMVDALDSFPTYPVDIIVGGATIFVTDVDQFIRA